MLYCFAVMRDSEEAVRSRLYFPQRPAGVRDSDCNCIVAALTYYPAAFIAC